MDSMKRYSWRSFLTIILFMILLLGLIAGAIYYGATQYPQQITSQICPESTPADFFGRLTMMLGDTSGIYLMGITASAFLLVGIVLWLILRSIAKGAIASAAPAPAPQKAPKAPQPKEQRTPEQDQRQFLYLLTLLQKEGRLVDFLQEDLEMYDDEQIGAAVRSIHAGCRKTLDKSLGMTSVIDENEGDAITVVAGFNPAAIKLTGRVTGEPPFTGVVRHKGWRAQKVNMPDLAATEDPTIIAPAEVEID